jgi:hypothetical protein
VGHSLTVPCSPELGGKQLFRSVSSLPSLEAWRKKDRVWVHRDRPQFAAIEHVEGGEKRGRAVALVVMGHGPATAGL